MEVLIFRISKSFYGLTCLSHSSMYFYMHTRVCRVCGGSGVGAREGCCGGVDSW